MGVYLGLETSCDETAAAVVRDGRKVLSAELLSQTILHQQYGGVVPEVAARQHLETINDVVAKALSDSGLSVDQLSGVACTVGPGLVGTLLVGLSAAKAFAWAHDLPLVAVDHLLAHVCANYIDTDLEPPFVALLVSGGHTQIIHFSDYASGRILGQTLDDAAGEAYDKVARLLGLGYPGGPAIDKLAAAGDARAFAFPEGSVPGYDFSFSGLKTAVLRCVQKLTPPYPLADLAASFQEAVTQVLVRKTLEAQEELGTARVVLAGGVAANRALRAKFQERSTVPVYFPAVDLCTDNAAMVAAAAHFCGRPAGLDVSVYSRKCM
jgi:N6-L-threonylcarbamoyladenine synthase